MKRLVSRLLRPFPTHTLWALQGLDLTIHAGEAVGLSGTTARAEHAAAADRRHLPADEQSIVVRGRVGGSSSWRPASVRT